MKCLNLYSETEGMPSGYTPVTLPSHIMDSIHNIINESRNDTGDLLNGLMTDLGIQLLIYPEAIMNDFRLKNLRLARKGTLKVITVSSDGTITYI